MLYTFRWFIVMCVNQFAVSCPIISHFKVCFSIWLRFGMMPKPCLLNKKLIHFQIAFIYNRRSDKKLWNLKLGKGTPRSLNSFLILNEATKHFQHFNRISIWWILVLHRKRIIIISIKCEWRKSLADDWRFNS